MKMTREYYNTHVDMGIEIEYEDGHRTWVTLKGSEIESWCKEHIKGEKNGVYFSDEDLKCKQSDVHVRNFLNLVQWNCYNNPKFKNMGLWTVLEKALDAELEVV